MIFTELSSYTGSTSAPFAASAVKTMGRTALKNEGLIPQCLSSLLGLMGRSDGIVLSEVVVVVSLLLRKKRGSEDEGAALRELCRKFPIIKDSGARAAILSLIGDLHDTHPTIAPQMLRFLGKNITNEPGEVRLQALTLAAKLTAIGSDSQIPGYILKICSRDPEFDVRDRARFLTALLETPNDVLKANLRAILFPPAKLPKWSSLDRVKAQYQIGTLSQVFGRELGGYEPLPEWAAESELPPDSVRNVVRKIDGREFVVREDGEEDEEEDVININDFFGEEKEAPDDEEEEADEEEDEPKGAQPVAQEEDDEEEQDLDGFFD
jgi:AP-3 complex subunit beta